MTPVHLNPAPSSFPVLEIKEERHLHQPDPFLSGPTTFFNIITRDQRASKVLGESDQLPDDQEVDKCVAHGKRSDRKLLPSSTSFQAVVNESSNAHKLSSSKGQDEEFCERIGEGSAKWMPSKLTMTQKAMNSSSSCSDETDKPVKFTPKFRDQQYHEINDSSRSISSSNNNIRVCADCSTTTTPLWRSGPRGPKSLCNACGIRQRKARRAMAAAAAAANGIVGPTEMMSSTKTKMHNKEKKSRPSHVAQCKKMWKPLDHPPHQSQKKLCFKNLALRLSKNPAIQRVFPQDVEEAAILLMELSCGFLHA